MFHLCLLDGGYRAGMGCLPNIPGSWDCTVPAIHPCCSHQCLLVHPEDSGQQVCMSSEDYVCNRGTGCPLCTQGCPRGIIVCWLFLEWDGTSRWTRKLRLRGQACTQGPTAANWRIWDSDTGPPTSEDCQGQEPQLQLHSV